VTSVRPLSPSARLFTSVAAVAALGLSGCAGTGMDAQTNAQYQAAIGANVRTGAIQLFNALAVDNGNGTLTLSAAVLNTTTQPVKLVSADIDAPDHQLVNSGVGTWPLIVGAGQLKDIGKAGSVIIDSARIKAGNYVTVKLVFSGKNSVSVDAPVVARNAIYESVATSGGGEDLPVKSAEEPGA